MAPRGSIFISRGGRGAAAAALFALRLLTPHAAPAQTVSVWVGPAETRVAPGEVCTLYVHVGDEVDSLSCAECCLGFDSTVVSFHSARQGELYDRASFPKFFDVDQPSADSVRVTACVLGYRSYILAPGSIFEVRFEALDPGITDVGIGGISVLDIDRNELGEDVVGGGRIIVTTQTGEAISRMPGARLSSYPNPFNPVTAIVLDLPVGTGRTEVTDLGIYDAAGRRVRRLFTGTLQGGRKEFLWNGRNDSGSAVASGIYLAVSRTGALRLERKLVLIR
jgi:hypothetical protein